MPWKQYSEAEPMPASRCSECGSIVTAEAGGECPPHQGIGGLALCAGSGKPTKAMN